MVIYLIELKQLNLTQLREYVPSPLFEDGYITAIQNTNQYLIYSPGELHSNQGSDNYIKATCTAILHEQIRFASINLKQNVAWGGVITAGGLSALFTIIKDMLANANCKLEYLDLSFSNMSLMDLNNILEALPADSKIKCLYLGNEFFIGDNEEEEHQEITRLANWLERTDLAIAICLDTKHDKEYPTLESALNNYYESKLPGLSQSCNQRKVPIVFMKELRSQPGEPRTTRILQG